MKLTSPIFQDGHAIPKKFTCEGDNINPPLEISEVPENAKSLVLIMDDPDAPDGIFNHWVLWNIDPKTKIIKKDNPPEGSFEGLNSAGKIGYLGPCPPSGTHVYLFKLYAIDMILPEDKNLDKREIRKTVEGHIIEKALLKGYYEKAHSENF